MQSKYFFISLTLFTGNIFADALHKMVSDSCINHPELYKQTTNIIDNTTLSLDEQFSQLTTLQTEAYLSALEKIEDHADNHAITLIKALDKFKASSHILLAFTASICGNAVRQYTTSASQPSFVSTLMALCSDKILLGLFTTLGSLYTCSHVLAASYGLRRQLFSSTPLSEWIDINSNYDMQRQIILINIARLFPPFPYKNESPQVYEMVDGIDVYSVSIETFLAAATKEESILRDYLWWENWANRYGLGRLLSFSPEITDIAKIKLQNIVRMQEIIQ